MFNEKRRRTKRMFKLTDKRGYVYYMPETNLPYQGYKNKLGGAVAYIRDEAEEGAWIKCSRNAGDTVMILASEIYVVEEVEK